MLGTGVLGIRFAQTYATLVCPGTGARWPHKLTPVFLSGWANDERNCVFGNAMECNSNNMAVPPAARPMGLPKKSVAAAVAMLAVCPMRSDAELASGLYVASCGFMLL